MEVNHLVRRGHLLTTVLNKAGKGGIVKSNNQTRISGKLSLLEYCLPCKSKCCKIGKLIGSPILDKGEASKIGKKHLKKIKSPSGSSYYIIAERKGSTDCIFLIKDNKCKIQKVKPLDCLCYPIKAIYKNNSMIFIIDINCPASNCLTAEFIQEARKVAINSIRRFDKETYTHWLSNNIGWVDKTAKILPGMKKY